MGKKVCGRHPNRLAAFICVHGGCELESFFCDLCKDGHMGHSDDWREIDRQNPQQQNNSNNIINNNNNLGAKKKDKKPKKELSVQERREMQQMMRSTMDNELKSDRILSEPEELKEFLNEMEERLLQRIRSVKGSLMQSMIEYKNEYHHLTAASLKASLKEGKISQKTYNDILQEQDKFLGLPVKQLNMTIANSLGLLDALQLKKFDNYTAHRIAVDARNNHQLQAGDEKQKKKLLQQQQRVAFKVSPFYEPTSKIEFFNGRNIIKVGSSDEAIVSVKPLKFDKSYQLNFSICPNGETPTFGVMLVQEDCLQGEICFMHEGQISFVSDLNENTASSYLMKQKGMLVRPAHDIFWIDIKLDQHTFNVYDEQKNLFFQLDRAQSPIEAKKNWYLAFHLYDISLNIL